MKATFKTFPLSVVILAKNEERNIERCLNSVRWCRDVVVVDDGSTDSTPEVARRAGARVVEHRFESFAKQRNWALDHAGLENEWVLMLDADETSTDRFRNELIGLLAAADEDVVAYRTCRKTMFGNRWLRYSDEFPCWIMRVVRRGRAYFEDSGHGEVPVPSVSGTMQTIREPFVHYPFSHGVSDWLVRHVRYADREARLELSKKVVVKVRDFISTDGSLRRRALRNASRSLPMRPFLRFFHNYIARGGFRDGIEGYMFSTLKSVYEAMIVVKHWELSVFEGNECRNASESSQAADLPVRLSESGAHEF